MLFLFLTTAHIFVFLKAFFMKLDSNSLAVSSLKMVSIFVLISSVDPGKIQHNFSSSLSVWGESTVKLAGFVLTFVVDKREGNIALDLPLKSKPSRLSKATIEIISPSSSETTSAAPSELSIMVSEIISSEIISSEILISRHSASVSRVP